VSYPSVAERFSIFHHSVKSSFYSLFSSQLDLAHLGLSVLILTIPVAPLKYLSCLRFAVPYSTLAKNFQYFGFSYSLEPIMSSADSEGRDNQGIGSQTGACGAHSSDQEPISASEETATVPPVDTLASNFLREASKPKTEEPISNFSDIPQEAVSPVVPRTFVLTKKLFKTPSERALEAAENERRLREAGEIFRQGLVIRPPTPITTQPTPAKPNDSNNDDDVQIVEKGQQTSPVELDTEAEDASATALFKSLKRSYQRKKKNNQNTVEDDIAFSKARNAEELRLKLKSRKRAYDDVESDIEMVEDDSLFFADETPSALGGTPKEGEDGISSKAPKKRRTCRPNKIPESALQDALEIGFDAFIAEGRKNASKKGGPKGTAKKKEPKEPKTRVSKAKDKKVDGASKLKRGRPHKGPKMLNIDSLFHNDIVSAAQANVGKATQPGFSSTNKKDALAELIASIPEEERTTHNADKNALDKATKSFTGHAAMKADGNNGWRLRGMQTSLYHYQLLGAAFMRERENSSTRPYGGLQSDEMGLGKTVTCLANIVDGQGPPNSPNRTTLIVCPGGLCSQWLNEIKRHVLPTTFQDVVVYRAGGRIESSNPTKTLSNMDIIITSYNEVLRSYPHCETPMHLVTPEAKTEWWSEYFKANCGVLHQIFFRRIVLDEGRFHSATAVRFPLLTFH
jgi:SNF2-related domain